MTKTRKLLTIFAGACLATLLSCSTTSTNVSSSWKTMSETGVIHRTLVIGVASPLSTRILFESRFTDELTSRGVLAYPSYAIFLSSGIPEKAAIAEAISARKIDTVLITRMVAQKDVKQYVPPAAYSSTDPFYGDWYGYYGSIYNYGYTAADVVNKTLVELQTNLYSASTNSLIWSATSNTTTQGGRADVIKSFISAMIKRMEKDGLIKS